MQLYIDKQSDVPARDQLRQQIIFLIGTGQLARGAELPSVRQLARQLHVHHNTISHSYSQLVRDGWLVKKQGRRLIVGQSAKSQIENFTGLDDLIDRAIRLARVHGYSLQQLTSRVRARLLAEPADHLLLVAPERNLAELIRLEIADAIGLQPDACSVSLLNQNPSIAIGAILITPSYYMGRVQSAVSADVTVLPVSYSVADEHLAAIRALSRASAIAVVSVSALFLETAKALVAPVIGRRHSFREFLLQWPRNASGSLAITDDVLDVPPANLPDSWKLPDESFPDGLCLSQLRRVGAPALRASEDLNGFDLLLCDSVGFATIRHRRSMRYSLIAQDSLAEIANTANALLAQNPTKAPA